MREMEKINLFVYHIIISHIILKKYVQENIEAMQLFPGSKDALHECVHVNTKKRLFVQLRFWCLTGFKYP